MHRQHGKQGIEAWLYVFGFRWYSKTKVYHANSQSLTAIFIQLISLLHNEPVVQVSGPYHAIGARHNKSYIAVQKMATKTCKLPVQRQYSGPYTMLNVVYIVEVIQYRCVLMPQQQPMM